MVSSAFLAFSEADAEASEADGCSVLVVVVVVSSVGEFVAVPVGAEESSWVVVDLLLDSSSAVVVGGCCCSSPSSSSGRGDDVADATDIDACFLLISSLSISIARLLVVSMDMEWEDATFSILVKFMSLLLELELF